MPFGTLRRDSYFSPGQVLDEARQLDAAVRALADVMFAHAEDLNTDDLAGWNAFIESWRAFWADCNAWDGWIFRAKDSTRDELLNLEATYQTFKAGAPGADQLPDVEPEGARTEDNISHAVDQAGGVLKKAGWEVVAGAAVVVVGLVVLFAVARKGGVPGIA